MRLIPVVAAGVLLAACASGPSATTATTASTASAASAASVAAVPTTASALDPCTLLNAVDLSTLVGDRAGDPQHGTTSGLPHCRWRTGSGAYVQTTSVPSPEWARALPEAVEGLRKAGLVKDPAMDESLSRTVARIVAGEAVGADEACAVFSQMNELQGQPAGTTSVVAAFPTPDRPQGVTGQICTQGRFTTILVYDTKGVDAGVLVPVVTELLPRIHRLATG